MATYQLINLQTGEFRAVSLEDAAEIAQLDPHEIEWAIEEHGVCETETHQITKLPEPPEMADEIGQSGEHKRAEGDGEQCDGGDAGDGENQTDHKQPLPVFVYISQEEFEAHLAQHPASVIRLKWDEPIVREAVEADKGRIMAELEGEGDEPSGVFHLTRESIALIR